MPLSLIALAKVASTDAGVASSLLNTGQQVGGALGLAVLGTVAWSAVANSLRSQAAAAAKTAAVHLSLVTVLPGAMRRIAEAKSSAGQPSAGQP